MINLTYGGTATNVTDYGRPATVTIPAGSLTGTVTLTVVNDAIVEGSETVDVTLASISSSSTGVSLGATLTATNTIADNDTSNVSIANTTNGDEAGLVSGIMTVTLTNQSSTATTVSYTIGGASTATSGSDYTALPLTVVIPANTSTADITIPVLQDLTVEPGETVIVDLTAATSNAAITAAGSATNTIADNDTATVTIANTTNGNEAGAVSGTLTATQTAVAAADTVINLTYGGTATNVTDYGRPATVTIPAGSLTGTVTLTVVNDAIVEGSETVDVTLASISSSSTGVSLGATLTATNTIADNDTGSLVIDDVTIGEAGGPATFTVTLTGVTQSAFTVDYQSSNVSATAGSDYTAVGPTALNFTGTPTASPQTQTFTVPITNDTLVEGSETATLTLSGLSNTFGGQLSITDATGTLSNVSIADTTNGSMRRGRRRADRQCHDRMAMTRRGYTVVGRPADGVGKRQDGKRASRWCFTPSRSPMSDLGQRVSDLSEATAMPATLTFTMVSGIMTVTLTNQSSTATTVSYTIGGASTATSGSDYTALPLTVVIPANTSTADITIPVLQDLTVEPGETVIVNLTAATSNAAITAAGSATNTIADNDTPGYTVVGGPLTVSETGTTASFTVVLDAQPLTDVVISVSASDLSEATALPATLTFTNGDWNVAQTVTVTGIDDAIADGNIASSVTLAVVDASSDNAFDPLADQIVNVTTTDDDTPGYTVVGGPLTVSETGTTASFTVVLDAQPLTDVVISVSASDLSEATALPATLTFTNGDWNVAQTVTVTGIDDAIADGNIASSVTLAVVDASSDNAFDPLADQIVNVTTTDDDTPGYTVVGGPLTVSETGTTASFTVVLDAQPLTDVVISVSASDLSEATALPATLTFTNGDWNVAQTVTVTGIDDAIADGNIASSVTLAVVDASSDNAFDPLADQIVNVTTTDDDTPGYTVVGGPLTVSETGTTASFTVVLDAQPLTDVVISVSASDLSEATALPATLTFTNGDWNVAQTVTVTGIDDAIADGNIASSVTLAVVDASSDNAFDPLADQIVNVTTTDDDTPGYTVVGGPLTVSETGTTASFTVVLDAQPLTDVVISVSASDLSEATALPATLTFTNGDWNVAQTVTVTGIDDAIADGNIASSVTLAVVDASSDNAFDPLADQIVNVTTTDDDTPGYTVVGGPLTVSETGTTASFTVVLDAQPLTDVVISVSASDLSEATALPATLTFTNGDWNVAQTVTVTGIDDAIADGNIASSVTLAVVDASSDNAFDPLADQIVNVTTTDDDTPGYTVVGGPLTVSETGTTASFTVVLDAQPLTDVVISVSASDLSEATALPATLTFTNGDWNVAQTVTVTGIDDAIADGNIASSVTLAVVDASSDNAFDPLADQIVNVTTTDDDTPGYTVVGGPLTVSETGTTASFTVVLDAQPLTDVVISVSASDLSEATALPATLTFTNGDWNVAQTVTVTGIDDAIADGNIASSVTLAVVDASSDNAFDRPRRPDCQCHNH